MTKIDYPMATFPDEKRVYIITPQDEEEMLEKEIKWLEQETMIFPGDPYIHLVLMFSYIRREGGFMQDE